VLGADFVAFLELGRALEGGLAKRKKEEEATKREKREMMEEARKTQTKQQCSP